ncbi:thiamine ABC transporter substrate binding subunit [uncultured Treponema sp.]|uniref:thiamine ABC transporter substrate-binding protein n=1 Tax=uncultured Treponema sp. TaxID=162155 RepID=UPI0025E5A12A|nr:thiamine ABC transporter substrate binding subunit [uncultured Treponema sp.]
MKKSLLIFSSIITSSVLFFACHKAESSKNGANGQSPSEKGEVTIYTYGSFVSEWGPAPKLAEKFEKSTGIKANFVDCGDAVQALSRAILEKNNCQADIILGIDNNTAPKALESDILESYKPKNADSIIDSDLQNYLGTKDKIIPYDYSHFAFIFDTRSNLPEPKKLADLTNPVYKDKIILMDPRTSTPGLGFVAWTRAIFTTEASYKEFWASLKANILSLAPSWSTGYGLFTNGEAPLVISYTTSPAANLEYDKIDYYKALIFEDGHAIQVEGAGILKNAPNRKLAELFMDFLISEEAQEELPLTQWMYPVNKNVKLPECYKKAAQPSKTVTCDNTVLQEAADVAVITLK